jgi:hypothetical protein
MYHDMQHMGSQAGMQGRKAFIMYIEHMGSRHHVL